MPDSFDAPRRAYRRYAHWLAGVAWSRFAAVSVLCLLAAVVLDGWPRRWMVDRTVDDVWQRHATALERRVDTVERHAEVQRPARAGDIVIDSEGAHLLPGPAQAPPSRTASGVVLDPPPQRATGPATDLAIDTAPGNVSAVIDQAQADARAAMREAVDARRDITGAAWRGGGLRHAGILPTIVALLVIASALMKLATDGRPGPRT